jgi:hypothetical protein
MLYGDFVCLALLCVCVCVCVCVTYARALSFANQKKKKCGAARTDAAGSLFFNVFVEKNH